MDRENIFVVTGDSGHGLTHATIAGILIRDLIMGNSNPWAALYDPRRLSVKSLTELVKVATQATLSYGDWLSAPDVESIEQIGAGQGAIVREGLRKVAVYKDELHRLHCFSPACPHLGGQVHWNATEKTWDCPCHGSRFDRFGQVLNGPANQPLEPDVDPMGLTGEPTPHF